MKVNQEVVVEYPYIKIIQVPNCFLADQAGEYASSIVADILHEAGKTLLRGTTSLRALDTHTYELRYVSTKQPTQPTPKNLDEGGTDAGYSESIPVAKEVASRNQSRSSEKKSGRPGAKKQSN